MSLNSHCNRWLLQALISPTRPTLTPSRRICLWTTSSNPSYRNPYSSPQRHLQRSYSNPTSKQQPQESTSSTSSTSSSSSSSRSSSAPSSSSARRSPTSARGWAHSMSGGPSIEILKPVTAKAKSSGPKWKDRGSSGERDRRPRHRSDGRHGERAWDRSGSHSVRAATKTTPEDKGRWMSKEKRALFLSKNPESWQVQKKALTKKFETGWNPRKKLSPDAVEGIRGLHAQDPEKYSTESLSEHFKVSPEAIRRILKSKWRPKDQAAMQERRERWARRHDRIWDQKAELGLRPPRTTDRRLEHADEFEENLRAEELLRTARQD